MSEDTKPHHCLFDTAGYRAGRRISYCVDDDEGFFWIGVGSAGECETMVHYCPFCGLKAPSKALTQTEWEVLKEQRNNS